MEDNKKKTPLSAEELDQVTGGVVESLGLIDGSLVEFEQSKTKFKCKFCDQVFVDKESYVKHKAKCPKKVQIF